jgi:hypothetical protein
MKTSFLSILIFIALIIGCGESDPPQEQILAENPKADETPTTEVDLGEVDVDKNDNLEFPKLQAQLVDLIASENPQAFAKENRIVYQNGKVRVVIILTDENRKIADRFDVTIEAKAKTMIQALVLLTELGELSNEPYVDSIRLPLQPVLF